MPTLVLSPSRAYLVVVALLAVHNAHCSRTELASGPRWTPPVQWNTDIHARLLNSCTQRGPESPRCRGYVGLQRDSELRTTMEPIGSLGGRPEISARGSAVIANGGRLFVRGDNSRGGLGLDSAREILDWTELQRPELFVTVSQNLDSLCAISHAGRAWCGGRIPVWSRQSVALQAIDAPLRFEQIVVGEGGVCALTTLNGKVYCWGGGALTGGELGTTSPTPVEIAMLPQTASIAVGNLYACAIDMIGVVRCWGWLLVEHAQRIRDARYWPVGGGASISSRLPAVVANVPLAKKVSISRGVACIVSTNSETWCWGDNALGQMGNGSTLGSFTPTRAFPAAAASDVAVGLRHICVRQGRDEIYCSGDDQYSAIGLQNRYLSSVPVPNRVAAVQLLASGCPRVLLSQDGLLREWHYGRDEFATNLLGARTVSAPARIESLSAAKDRACLITTDHKLFCWGDNLDAASGLNEPAFIEAPTEVSRLGNVTSVALAERYPASCATNDRGELFCWGFPPTPLLDNSTRLPRVVLQLAPLRSVSLSSATICGVTQDRRVQCTGRTNANGELGSGDRSPVLGVSTVAGLADVAQVAVLDDDHFSSSTCARTEIGEVWCWGANGSGQLANGTRDSSPLPVRVQSLPPVSQLSCGTAYCCALADSNVWCWGANEWGQLGDSTRVNRLVPTRVPSLDDVAQVVAGSATTCVRRVSGEMMCWGRDSRGEFGEVKALSTATPILLR